LWGEGQYELTNPVLLFSQYQIGQGVGIGQSDHGQVAARSPNFAVTTRTGTAKSPGPRRKPNMSTLTGNVIRAFACALLAAFFMLQTGSVQAADKVRVSFGDVVDVEALPMVIALERAKDRGVDYEITSFAQEDLAIQAVVGGQADLGIATPYAVMQKVKDLRIFFQQEALVFYCVVSKEYKTWKDLDGQPIVYHARGSGTEAYGNFMAKREGIKFSQISYLAGSGNRSVAMLNGTIKATMLDQANTNRVLKEAPDKFHVLPGPTASLTNEALFANKDWIASHQKEVNIITEEFLKLYREMKKDPGVIAAEREKRGLLSDQPKEALEGITDFIKEGVGSGLWNPEGGGPDVAKADLDFYATAGQIKGSAADLKVEDFWDFGPLDAAKKALGG
jgi:ABC-type nitrate/sulfonate/bicarbonate transport system substrate-binding protein